MFEPRLGVDLLPELVVVEDPPVADDIEGVLQEVGPSQADVPDDAVDLLLVQELIPVGDELEEVDFR